MPSLLPLCILVIFVAVLSTTAPGTSKVSHPNKNICLWQKCPNLGYSQPWRVLQEGNTRRVCWGSSKKWGEEKRRWCTKEMSQASMQAEIPSDVAQTVLLNCSALNKLDVRKVQFFLTLFSKLQTCALTWCCPGHTITILQISKLLTKQIWSIFWYITWFSLLYALTHWHPNPNWYPEISGMSWGAKISDFGPLWGGTPHFR